MTDNKIPVTTTTVVEVAPDKKLESLVDAIYKMIALRNEGFVVSENPFEPIFGMKLTFTRESAIDSALGKIEELDISNRSYNCLKNGNINTITELIGKTELDLLRIRTLGRKSLREIKDVLTERNLSLRKW